MENLTGKLKKQKKVKKEQLNTPQELATLLQARNIDTARFEPIGAGFYHLYEDCFNASVICIDRKKFEEGTPYLVKIILEDFTNDEYLAFRKRFEVIINPEYRNYYNLNIADELLQSQIT
ncbi:hypothetical protein [Flavobacterium alkalisoli]|uniref:hypothetical protein n=1 Tax=Flavobacterium alkalisoli TaxID=2602769 RepID=UPI003A948AE9